MATFKRLYRHDRKDIEDRLGKGVSFAQIASSIYFRGQVKQDSFEKKSGRY